MTTLLENLINERIERPMTVKLFTHNDLDGIGCAIVARHAFKDNCHIDYCGYHDIDERLIEFLKSEDYEEVSAVFITDLSVNENTAKLIQESFADKVQLIDHHSTALWLNEYSWASVQVYEKELPGIEDKRENRLSSGTSLFFHFLHEYNLINNLQLVDLVEQIRRYDTWEWANVFNEVFPKQLNDLLTIIGRYDFVDRFADNPEAIFTFTENILITLENKKIERLIKLKKDSIRELELGDYTIGVVFSEQYISETGNELAKEFPHYDFIALVNMSSGSISLRGVKEDIHLGELAQTMGGGGHPKAAGINIPDTLLGEVISFLLSNLQNIN